ncbi:hypothetical protein HYW75_02935 [Candidatus Pacearchaeota archaeon]|nr:hypothetical protein [Candidatus Pacearchaeota archaeon]
MLKIKNKKAQVAIFFIIAIVIVAFIAIIFVFSKKAIVPSVEIANPQERIESCAREATNEAADLIIKHGGFVEPRNFKEYNKNKVEYLCENTGNYKPCINQHPLLLEEIKNEILDFALPRIDQCFSIIKEEYEKRQYNVIMEPMKINISLATDRIYLFISRDLTLSKQEKTKRFKDFKIEINNPLFDLTKVATEIGNQEAKFCYFEYVGYMILYPRFGIKKVALSDSTKVYTIKDKHSNKEMNIAVRGCAIPPGI